MPSRMAANATAAPWLPPEAATTPAAGTLRRSRLVKASRGLNEPVCWKSSSLRLRDTAGVTPKSDERTSITGVRRTYDSIWRCAARISSRVRSISRPDEEVQLQRFPRAALLPEWSAHHLCGQTLAPTLHLELGADFRGARWEVRSPYRQPK